MTATSARQTNRDFFIGIFVQITLNPIPINSKYPVLISLLFISDLQMASNRFIRPVSQNYHDFTEQVVEEDVEEAPRKFR